MRRAEKCKREYRIIGAAAFPLEARDDGGVICALNYAASRLPVGRIKGESGGQ